MATISGPGSPETYGRGQQAETHPIFHWSITSGKYRPEVFSHKTLPGQNHPGLPQAKADIENIETHYSKDARNVQLMLYALEKSGNIPSKEELYTQLQAIDQAVGAVDPEIINEQLDELTRQSELYEGVQAIVEQALHQQSLYGYSQLEKIKELTGQYVGRIKEKSVGGKRQTEVPVIRTLNVMEQRGLIGRIRKMEDTVRIIIAWQAGIELPAPER